MIQHLVAAGCSFTADGVGGVPPNELNPTGACTFIPDEAYVAADPKTWIGFLAQRLQVRSLINLAANGHGNTLTAMNIMQVLTKFDYDPVTTMIMFNITDAGRLDVMCDWHHPQASQYCTWPQQVLPYRYLDPNSEVQQTVKKNMGLEQVETVSCHALQGLMCFLKENKFQFKFLTMRDYTNHSPLSALIQQHEAHWIPLSTSAGMMEYAQAQGLTVSQRDPHPTVQGQKLIADWVERVL